MAVIASRGANRAHTFLVLAAALLAQCCQGQQQQAADQKSTTVSFLAPRQANPLPLQTLSTGAPQGRVKDAVTFVERGDASWGSFLTSTDLDGLSNSPTKVKAPHVGIRFVS